MGFLNRVGFQGFVTEDVGSSCQTSFVLEHHKGHTETNVLYVDQNGTVLVGSGTSLVGAASGTFSGTFVGNLSGSLTGTLSGLASSVKYEFHDHSGSQTIPESPSYAILRVNSLLDNINGGLTLWNTSSNVFKPTTLGQVYSIRLTGKTGPTDGTGNREIGRAHV